MLRYTPDDGTTWIPLANDVKQSQVEVPQELLDGVESVRLQLAVSTGFRTTLVDVPDAVQGRKLVRHVTISVPEPDTLFRHGEIVELVGITNARLNGTADPAYAYWTSHRDGFLAEGLRATVIELSVGRQILRLTVADADGQETTQTVAITVVPDSYESELTSAY